MTPLVDQLRAWIGDQVAQVQILALSPDRLCDLGQILDI